MKIIVNKNSEEIRIQNYKKYKKLANKSDLVIINRAASYMSYAKHPIINTIKISTE